MLAGPEISRNRNERVVKSKVKACAIDISPTRHAARGDEDVPRTETELAKLYMD